MSDNFLSARGCIFLVPATGSGKGFYSLQPSIASSADSPVFIQGVTLNDNDLIAPVKTLDNMKVIYTFGQDFGNVTIQGEILLGPDSSKAGGVAALVEWFTTNRVSKSKSAVSVSLPGRVAYKFYPYGLGIGAVDPEHHIQAFAITGVIAEPPE
jgi:hypothetical protein